MNALEILRTRKKDICDNWVKKVNREIPLTKKYDKTAIENSVPELIESIIEILNTGDTKGIKSHSIKHGWQRTRKTSYSMVHIIREYNLLRAEIFNELDSLADKITHEERDVII